MNKNATITIGDLRKLLSDGRLSDDMPVAIYTGYEAPKNPGTARGVHAVEIHTLKDGSKTVTFFQHGTVYAAVEIESSSEIFGSI